MGKTKFQRFIFTLMMCFGMVLGMTAYNMILNEGYSSQFFLHLAKDFWLGFVVALILDIFIVGKISKSIVFNFIKPNKKEPDIKLIVAISISMVVGMVLFMSMYGSIVAFGFSLEAIKIYPINIVRNFIMALPLNLLIISPVVRFLFVRIFPERS